jgi:hypothetical protein
LSPAKRKRGSRSDLHIKLGAGDSVPADRAASVDNSATRSGSSIFGI